MKNIAILRNLLICACPQAASLPDLGLNDCPENIGQIQKLIFQRKKNGAVINEMVIGTSDPALLATWTPLLTATDSTKALPTPLIAEPVNEPGEKREYGGGNTTPGGIPVNIGTGPSSFTANFLSLKQSIVKGLKDLQCEQLSVFLVNEGGQIIGQTDDPETPTKFSGIPVYSLFVSDKRLGMYEEPDRNIVSWMFAPNWSDNLHIVKPTDFNALEL